MSNNIIFIGMPGCGKSTIGSMVAKSLGYTFLDIDKLIEVGQNAPLQTLVDTLGVDQFLQLESDTIKRLRCKNHVLAPGGSAVLLPETAAHLKQLGTLIYLHVPLQQLTQRIQNLKSRGIALEKGQTLAQLFAQRQAIYKQHADFIIHCPPNTTRQQTAQAVLAAISGQEHQPPKDTLVRKDKEELHITPSQTSTPAEKDAMPSAFRTLGVCPPILKALSQMGYQTPSPIQEKAIPPALDARDILGIAQTGTGKTCAFSVPILQQLSKQGHQKKVRALILTPTRELALQIEENITAYRKHLPLKSTVIFGGVGQNPQVQKLKQGIDILVATPGRLCDLYNQKLLDLSEIQIFVLDEADRMLDMGFIHDVKKIIAWLPKEKQTMLFSATMPKEISSLADGLLKNPVKVAVTPVSSPVDIIGQEIFFVDRVNKTNLLAQLLKNRAAENALVFTRTKHGANKVARELAALGISSAAIHGSKSQTARQQALLDFKHHKITCLVATDIAARGIDIDSLAYVFNYNLPEVPETYVHRIGRTGRAGRGGNAISLCDFTEKPLLKEIEKLLGKAIPVTQGHPFPMENFDPPKRDKKGKLINPDEQEARDAARLRVAQRRQAAKSDAETSASAAKNTPVQKKKTAAPSKTQLPQQNKLQEKKSASSKKQPNKPSGQSKPSRPALSESVHAQESSAVQTEIKPKYRPNPLDGDVILDATARLLAPKKISPPPAKHTQDKPAGETNVKNAHTNTRKPAGRQAAPATQNAKTAKKQADAPAVVASAKSERKVNHTQRNKPADKTAKTSSSSTPAPVQGTQRKTQSKKSSLPRKDQSSARKEAAGGNASRTANTKDPQTNKNRRGGAGARTSARPPQVQSRTKDSTEQSTLMKPYYLEY